MSADRVKWEHIHRVFELCNRNVSETARRLKMTEGLFREYYLKDLQDNLDKLVYLFNLINCKSDNKNFKKLCK